jgi:hypothetical protein
VTCSTLVLDAYWAAGCPSGSEIGAHLESCARCSAYLAELRALDALPAAPRRRRRWAGSAAAMGALAAAAAVAVFVSRTDAPSATSRDGYVATKSAPATQVLVRRAGQTTVWDGRAPVRAGDALALRVACEGMPRASVLVPTGGAWARAWDGPCPDGDPLPFTLVVDERPGDEHVAVVLSRDPLEQQAAAAAAGAQTRTEDVWTVLLVFAKSSEAP